MMKYKGLALIPLFVFIGVFIGSGIYFDNFYKFPAPMAVLIAVAVAMLLFKDPIQTKIETFIRGCGDSKIITMCLIYLLAGAFTTITKAIGATDFLVSLGIGSISGTYLAIGIFIISCLLSFSIGTSVGAIVALGPIVVGLAEYNITSLPLFAGSLLGGAMFGDNLSLISDTTIAATQTMGSRMKDKFIANFKIAGIAALLTLVVIFFTQGETVDPVLVTHSNAYYLLLPYIAIIVLSIIGIHVFVVLLISIALAIGIGLCDTSYGFVDFMQFGYDGFLSVNDIFILSLITGGLAAMIERAGGIDYIISHVQKIIRGSKTALLAIASVVSLINFAVANNTVSIIIAGPIAKKITSDYGINKAKATSILDIFSCIVQGILPYGAQVLILLSLTNQKLSYIDLLSNSYYLFLLLIVSTAAIFITSKTRFSKEEAL